MQFKGATHDTACIIVPSSLTLRRLCSIKNREPDPLTRI